MNKIIFIKWIFLVIALAISIFLAFDMVVPQEYIGSPFEKNLPPLIVPVDSEKPVFVKDPSAITKPVETYYNDPKTGNKSYVYQPKEAFKIIVTKNRYPKILPDKSIYGVVSLTIAPGYKASSNVIYMKKKYKFDRLSWAIRTGWNETIPFLSRLNSFKKHLKSFSVPVYAHFYIKGVREYPEYPGQYYNWPREDLEDYYLYILQKIDTVASQN